VALAPTLLVALLAGKPNKLDVLNQWLNILQSIQLPFAVVPVCAHAHLLLCALMCIASGLMCAVLPCPAACGRVWQQAQCSAR
jgi:hypothetical protein